MAKLVILNPEDLQSKEELCTYFLELAAAIRSQLKDCEMIMQLAWRIFSSVPKQFGTAFIVCVPFYLTASKVVKKDSVEKAKDMSSSLPACDYLLICRISLEMVKTKKCSSICWKMLSLKKSTIYIKWPCSFPIKVGALKLHQQVLQESAHL